ncbi:Polyketide synthase modules and related protein [Hahella chejuensis KCTC 2396]|uniref:Polyketide synthase modules and related protein n=1 Tax=Hahella chejuensis (strain KCTC 2396) TaxID=349521 RepID=Q2SHZ0_HAHCH|nr:type I polyketide synthase [Hahella chejuensis]ABC29734.1 Polyketide synthase modules and related protein [Hahella chejuensis KCTC 2396]
MTDTLSQDIPADAIAIVGMACRFPGADDIEGFWRNLLDGVVSTTRFTREQLLQAGVPAALIDHPDYVPIKGVVNDYDKFDAAFFGYTPREAEMMDPQHRLFLESCWRALEDAGHTGQGEENRIGVFAGVGMPTYILRNIIPHPEYTGPDMDYQLLIGNDKDFAATRVSYKMDLKGPSFNVNTACSTSLVAVHLACQSLLSCQCDMALAGASTLRAPQEEGYLYQEGGIPSPDGQCRAFDADAQGVVGGSGVGVVLLRRLEDALEDGDDIYAVIRGSAINNDGADKIGYTAPSVDGEAAVIAEAQALADISADTISYVEAHGTGTPLGDPIEVAALTKAFRLTTARKGFCALGSVKTNFGHLDTAAGMAGLIKAALAIKHGKIPSSRHFQRPNPKLDLENSPFFVNAETVDWPAHLPRRAGVSSFGVGGTNSHVVLEQAPDAYARPHAAQDTEATLPQLLLVSARTDTALKQAQAQLREHLHDLPARALPDVAFTLACGRRRLEQRAYAVCHGEAADFHERTHPEERPIHKLAFLLTGQGSQYAGMARSLYRRYASFRRDLDQCADLLQPLLNRDIRSLLCDDKEKDRALTPTALAQPLNFALEYALARLLQSWGLQPDALLGHSLGEYVAACLAKVFALPDALRLLVERGRLMQDTAAGAMLVVSLGEGSIIPYLRAHAGDKGYGQRLSLAAVNSPECCTLSGPPAAIEQLQTRLIAEGVTCQRLNASGAFHSPAMEPVAEPLRERLRSLRLQPPQIPIVSNLSGDLLRPEQATDPDYWVRHMLEPVRFADGLQTLRREGVDVCVEVGAGRALTALAHQQGWRHDALSLIPPASRRDHPEKLLLETLGELWRRGCDLDWRAYYAGVINAAAPETRRRYQRLHLPGYPFARQRHWIDPPTTPASTPTTRASRAEPPLRDWFYAPSWRRLPLCNDIAGQTGDEQAVSTPRNWLVLVDDSQMARGLREEIERRGDRMTQVRSTYERSAAGSDRASEDCLRLDPERTEDFQALFAQLQADGKSPDFILHAWACTPQINAADPQEHSEKLLNLGYSSLIRLIQQFDSLTTPMPMLCAVTATAQSVLGDETITPELAALMGPIKVAPLEYAGLQSQCIDVVPPQSEAQWEALCRDLIDLAQRPGDTPLLALRGLTPTQPPRHQRWVCEFTPTTTSAVRDPQQLPLRDDGVYLITGGLGGIGLQLAECVAQQCRARLILAGRQPAPAWSEDADANQGGLIAQLPDPKRIAALETELKDELAIQSVDAHPGLRADLHGLCSAYLAQFIGALWREHMDGADAVSVDKFMTACGLDARFDKFFRWMFAILAEDGVVELENDQVRLSPALEQLPDPGALRAQVSQRYPGFAPMLEFLDHCVSHYRPALTGEVDAISVLYPSGQGDKLKKAAAETVEHTHHRLYGLLLQRLLRELIQARAAQPDARPLRILEIGAGAGILTDWIAPALREANVEYWFTDIGRSFVMAAEQRFQQDPALAGKMRFAKYDASLPPEKQGLDPHSFDLVIELDAVHATADLPATMGQTRRLLAPGGLLCLLESTHTERWTNMAYGLAAGWWCFADGLRENCPLLSLPQWRELLESLGYTNVRAFPGEDMAPQDVDCGLILAAAGDADVAEPFALVSPDAERGLRDRSAKLRRLRSLGAQVMTLQLDIADLSALQEQLTQAQRRFGPINGLIHCAASENRGPIQLKQPDPGKGEFAAKTHGVRNLLATLAVKDLDFVALSSSTSAVAPGVGDAEYCASNSCVDAFAHQLRSQGVAALSINWERWRHVGMACAYEALYRQKTGQDPEGGMDPATGADAFLRMLSQRGLSQVLMSRRRIDVLLRDARDANLQRIVEHSRLTKATPDEHAGANAPATDLERDIAAIWREVLGVKVVGRHDNFHDLGGDSLIAIKMASRLKSRFSPDISMQALFDYPSVAAFAAWLQRTCPEALDAKLSEEMDEGVL